MPEGSLLAVETAGGRAVQWYALYGTGPARLKAGIRDLEPYKAPSRWPTRLEIREIPRDDRNDVRSWLVGGLLLVLAAGAVVASRARLGRPTAA